MSYSFAPPTPCPSEHVAMHLLSVNTYLQILKKTTEYQK